MMVNVQCEQLEKRWTCFPDCFIKCNGVIVDNLVTQREGQGYSMLKLTEFGKTDS